MPNEHLESRLLNEAEIGTWEYDVLRNKVHLSSLASSLHGFDGPSDVARAPVDLLRMVHPMDRPSVRTAVRRSVENRATFECTYRLVSAGQAIRSVMVRASMEFSEQSDQVTRVSGVVFDNTLQLRAKSQVLEAQQRYQHLFEHVGDGYVLVELAQHCDSDLVKLTVIEANPALRRLYAVQPRTTFSPQKLFGSDEATWNRYLSRVLVQGEPADFVTKRTLPQRVLTVSVSILRIESPVRAAVCIREVTSEMELRASLHDLTEGLAATDGQRRAFLATLSHELRNPLAPIKLGLEHLQEADMVHHAGRSTLDAMLRQVEHMSRLLDDLLDVQRMQLDKLTLRRRSVRLSEIVSLALDISKSSIDSAGHALTRDIREDAFQLLVDPDRIAQVIANLLINAARYSADGGSICLKGVVDASGVLLTVSDSGEGLSADDEIQIFDLFKQIRGPGLSEQGGLGVGLTLARKLMTLHAGSVESQSDGVGRGSRFTITLPPDCVKEANADTQALQSATSRGIPDVSTSKRVLIVDDNPDIRNALARLLARRKFEVESASTGCEALEKAPLFQPDVVLIDIGLPDITGYEVAKSIKGMSQLSRTRLIAITGWGSPEDISQAIEAGFDIHMTKPVSSRDVLGSIERATELPLPR